MKDRKQGMASVAVVAAITTACLAAIAPANAEVTGAQLKGLYGSELQVLGDVESIDLTRSVLTVAGQHVSIAKETSFTYNGVAVEDQVSALRMLQPGDLVVISGSLAAPVQSVSRLKEAYVAGATTIFVKAKVLSTEQSLGRATVDELAVDLTPAMADPQFAKIEAGQIIEAVGIRPTAGGLLLASSVSPSSIVGTSARSI